MDTNLRSCRAIAAGEDTDRIVLLSRPPEYSLSVTRTGGGLGKQARAVEGLLRYLVELNLKIAKLVVVRIDVLITLHWVLGGHALEFGHSPDDSSGGLKHSILNLKKGDPILGIVHRTS